LNTGSSAKEILSILTDEPSLHIMELLEKRELSARDISSTLNIPISSTYKKIKRLEQLKLVRITKVIRTLDGMDESFYTLSIKQISVTYKNNTFSFDIQQKAFDDKIVRLWQKFKN
jgi:DNA-binding transcriptional ArsR family regulator